MARDANIPVFLWVATAALVHILWGWEAEQVASVIESRENVRRFAHSVMRHVQLENRTLEVALLDESELERVFGDAASQPGATEEPVEEESLAEPEPEPPDQDADGEEPEDETAAELEQPKPEPEEQKPEEEKKKVQEVQITPMDAERRIAVQQRVQDENQPDNPDAEFIADQANRTKTETQARITSTEENSAVTNPGTNMAAPSDAPGNGAVTEIGQVDDTPGDPNKAAAESPKDGADEEVAHEHDGASGGHLQGGEPARVSAGDNVESSTRAEPASRGQKAQAAQRHSESAPDFVDTEHGKDSAPDAAEERRAHSARAAVRRRNATPGARKSIDLRGFGSMNTTPGGLNPNLNPNTAMAVIGQDQLTRERRADGERRRSKHRGSWKAIGLEKWRSAIENYVASVQPGNQTALNTARRPFASYLNRIHLRLHPEFADSFLPSLDNLPRDHSLNRPDLSTFLEIVLNREDGRVVRMGVTRASGNTAFDVGALESVQRAAPFGPPPTEIVSPDGNVYLHWEFHRNPIYACSTYFARPYLLRIAPTPAPIPDIPAPPAEPSDAPLGGERHGRLGVDETDEDG